MTSIAEYEDLERRGPRLLGVAAVPLLSLVVANLVPLAGVLVFGWDLRGVMLLYWFENAVVALWAIVRMLVVGRATALPMIIFFCLHFGMFMFVHLVFVYALTDATDWGAVDWHGGGSFSAPARPGAGFFPSGAFWAHLSWLGAAALLVSHGISFFRNFIAGREWRRSSLAVEMGRPYPRMLIMHVAIIGGAFVIALLRQPVALLAVLVLLKIVVDSGAHIIEHRLARSRDKARPQPPQAPRDRSHDSQQRHPAADQQHQ
jgi:hypothetical protein